jgi:hypothetical protein
MRFLSRTGKLMGSFLRKLRGIIGTGLTWSIGWAAGWVAVGVGFGVPLGSLLGIAVNGALIGFIAGGSFATVLSIAERHRTLDQLSLKRVALWGFLGGVALPLFFSPRLLGSGLPFRMVLTTFVLPTAVSGLLGAGFAAGSVALARREERKLMAGLDLDALPPEGD